MKPTTKPRIIKRLSLEQYHQRPEFSHSQIEDLLESPPLFHGLHITHQYPRKESDAFDDGTIVHQVLTGGSLRRMLSVIPRTVLNDEGHRKGAAWKEWEAKHEGKILRKREECNGLFEMIQNAQAHAKVQWLFGLPGHFEQSMVCVDPESDVPIRARPDRISFWNGGILLVDIKTTRSANVRDFMRDAMWFGYHRQLAYYKKVVEILYPTMKVTNCLFITVNKTPAHEAKVIELPQRAIDLGWQQNADILRDLARRLRDDDWRATDADSIVEADLPESAYFENQWRIAT